jgi:hypothetical protein
MQWLSFKMKPPRFKGKLMAWTLSFLGGIVTMLYLAPEVQASGAFARQTGMSCTHCHTVRAPSMAAIGKMFHIQGYRFPHIYSENQHGEPGSIGTGKEGGSLKLTEQAIQYFWFRTRMRPFHQNYGNNYTAEEKKPFA